MSIKTKMVVLAFLVFLVSPITNYRFLPITTAYSAAPEELKRAIEEKAKGLEELNRQIQATQLQLLQTEVKGKTLNQEIKRIDSTVSQLGLNIKAGEITVDKLRLEVDALEFDIQTKEEAIALKKAAITEFLRELQASTNESSLLSLLKGKSLAESMLESQTIENLNDNLSQEVRGLLGIRDELNTALDQKSQKKAKVEVETFTLKGRKDILEDQRGERQTLLAQTKSQEKLYQKQLEELRRQQEAISDEIKEIEDELRKNFDPNLLPSRRSGLFAWPILPTSLGGVGRISQQYGIISSLYRGKPHNGLDIAAPVGTEVRAAEDGVVVAVDNNDRSSWRKYQYGKHIMIQHDNNLNTLYAHLSSQIVKKGERVVRGQIIGYSGNTGFSTGPHLHFGLYWGPSVTFRAIAPAAGLVPIGVLVDPEDYL